MTTLKIELPLFVGFYESELFNSDTLDNEFSSENMEHFRELYEDETLILVLTKKRAAIVS